jgi:hypothetical protein
LRKRRRWKCPEEMEQVQEAWGQEVAAVEEAALAEVPVAPVSALNAVKENLTSWEAPASRGNAPSVGNS